MSDHSQDLFPPSSFDEWASQYDQNVADGEFPFTGYDRVLAEIVRLAGIRPGLSVLDLGAGTANLIQMFVGQGCDLYGTDFSVEMLERARQKVPTARFFHHDLRQPLPPELPRRFDRMVSAYVFHHFEFDEKVAIVARLAREHLAPGGCLIIGDISFPTCQALDEVRQSAGEQWDDEPYWISVDAIAALDAAGMRVKYRQISTCAGVYNIEVG